MTNCVSCESSRLSFAEDYLYFGKQFEELFSNLTVLICSECGLWQVDHSLLDENKLTRYYRNHYRKDVTIGTDHYSLLTARGKGLAELAVKHVQSTKVRKVFELGAGYGYNLLEFRKRFSKAQLYTDEIADELPSDCIRQTCLEDGPFDIVIMSHVLEHLIEPKAFITRVIQNLGSGGLLIIEVPNEGSGDFLYQASEPPDFFPFHEPHVTFFNGKTLETFFSQNFTKVRIRHIGTAGPSISDVLNLREQKTRSLSTTIRQSLGKFPSLVNFIRRMIYWASRGHRTDFSNDTETFEKIYLRVVLEIH